MSRSRFLASLAMPVILCIASVCDLVTCSMMVGRTVPRICCIMAATSCGVIAMLEEPRLPLQRENKQAGDQSDDLPRCLVRGVNHGVRYHASRICARAVQRFCFLSQIANTNHRSLWWHLTQEMPHTYSTVQCMCALLIISIENQVEELASFRKINSKLIFFSNIFVQAKIFRTRHTVVRV